MELLLSILVVAGIAGFFYFRNKDKQKRNISVGLAVVSFLLFGIFFVEAEDGSTADEKVNDTEQIEEYSIEEVETEEETNTEEVAEDPGAENTTDEEIETEETETTEEEQETDYPIEYDEAVAIVTDERNGVGLSANTYLNSFNYDMANVLTENHNEFPEGAIFRSVLPLVDQYGNEEKTNVVTVYYSPETIEQINFDNWPTYDATGLFDTADNVFIHHAIQNEADEYEGYSDTAGSPDVFIKYQGTTAE